MDNISLYNKINSLPEDLKKEVQHFVEFLQTKIEKKRSIDLSKRETTEALKDRKRDGREFVNKWAGFLNSEDTDTSKFDYLSEKYR